MDGMQGLGRIARPGPAARPAARGGGGFRLPAAESGVAAALAGAAPTGLMALQEADDPAGRDRRGAARARDLLKELSALQAGLLRDGAGMAGLERLAALAEGEAPADPVLADALAGIALRARVELAKRGIMVAG